MKTLISLFEAGIALVLALVFGVSADLDRAQAEAATQMAYAVVTAKVQEVAACECGDTCKCEGECKCVGCKLDGSCCKCGTKAEPEPIEWKWFDGEYRKLQGEKVLEVRKYKKVAVQVCNGRRCTVSYKWIPVQ